MLISCEKCKKVFEINERHLNAQGVTAVCPYCEHKHRVKRIVVPYSVSQEEDTEPYDSKELKRKESDNTLVSEDNRDDDIEPIETKEDLEELAAIVQPSSGILPVGGNGVEPKRSYHIVDRRSGVRGIMLDRFVNVDSAYIIAAAVFILGMIMYLVLK